MIKIPREIFREYDIRGIVEKDLTTDLAKHLGQAIGSTVRRGGGKLVVVGQDCRTSGTALSAALSEGIASTGCDVVHIGSVSTPVGYWAIHYLKADGGVHVTGSHNPPEYNGFKMTLLGRSLSGSDIIGLYDLMLKQDYEQGQASIRQQPLLQAYIDDLASILKPAHRPLKVVVDAGNGTGGISAVPLYRRLGFEVIPLFCEMDGHFPNHHPDPTVEENLHDLRAKVLEERADLGIAFDGDADRIGVLDHRGEVVWGDKLMIILSRALLKEQPGATILGEVKCSKTMYDAIAEAGGKPLMGKTGHSLIKSKMKETHALLAGEMSGHIFYAHRYYGFDDGVYAGGRLLEILSQSHQNIPQLLKGIPQTFATPEIRFDCQEDLKFKLVSQALHYFQSQASQGKYIVKDIDGARVEWSDGWGLVRCSNTQPILVMRFEANNEKRLVEIEALFRHHIERLKKELTA